ncbi:ribosomal protein L22/L17 [Pelagophyceae sp. CCMP2097]|nr:ribosomal protein L22/L17 [Pelagophyceae sp. CCMP2097]
MGKYSFDPEATTESSKARGASLRAHFKQCREVCHALKDMKLPKAKAFLEDVLNYKQAVPFTKFTGGCGRHAQGKLRKAAGDKVRWPQKATKMVLDLLKNAEANAETKGLDAAGLVVKHAQANRAQKQRRRTYRAHGRINPFMSSPAHIEIILTNEPEPVKKTSEEGAKKLTSRKSNGAGSNRK